MDMTFSVGGGVQFGFDVGGSYVPPEPEPGGNVPVLNGIMGLTFSGNLAEITGMQVLNGTATLEE